MSYLMPATTKDANVFRASSPLTVRDQNINPTLTVRDPNIDPILYNEDDCIRLAMSHNLTPPEEESQLLWSRTPSPTPQENIPLPSASTLKRSRSATFPPNSTPSKKNRNNTTFAAVQGLKSELQNFGATFLEGINAMAPPPSTVLPSPVRKTKAIQ